MLVSRIALVALLTASTLGAQAKKTPVKVTKNEVPAYTGPSTLDGIYTNEQASRGKTVYANSCKSCHSATTHTGALFAQWWKDKPLSDLFTFVLTKMPKNDPGSLPPEDVGDVVAYLLKMNALPAGPEEFWPIADSLKKFRVLLKPVKGSSPVKRAKP
jgi:mono/diheme cytochrome c family protein